MAGKQSSSILQYSGLAFQMMLAIAGAIYLGRWMDDRMALKKLPVFIWLLPLIVITGMLIKIVKDTSKK
jgi:hypothetical protein